MNPFIFLIPLLAAFLFDFSYAATVWPNEQANSTILCDWPFDSVSASRFGAPGGGGGQIVSDASAPFSPSKVWRNTRNATSRNAGQVSIKMPNAYQREIFYGFWFKASNPHYGWFNWYQKISLLNSEPPHIYMKMQEIDEVNGTFLIIGQPEHWRAVRDVENEHIAPDGYFWPNVHSEVSHVGQWYRIEVYCKRSTTDSSKDGIYRWWVNGTLAGNYTTVNLGAPLSEVFLTNVWDSEYADLPYQEYVDYDHMYVSLPPGVLQPLAISTDTLPTGNATIKYSTTVLAAAGGIPPYKWTLESGTLPAGITFYPATGFISGTPTEGCTISLVFKVTDALKATATKTISLVVKGSSAIAPGNAQFQSGGIMMSTQAALDRVSFDLQFANEGRFKISVFDLQGRSVWRYSASTGKGLLSHVVWNHGGKLNKGVYLVRAEQGGRSMTSSYCRVW